MCRNNTAYGTRRQYRFLNGAYHRDFFSGTQEQFDKKEAEALFCLEIMEAANHLR